MKDKHEELPVGEVLDADGNDILDERKRKTPDETFDPYGEAAADCPHKAMHANAEGLTGMRGEPISQADYDELSPTQLTGLRALNAERTRLARFAIHPGEITYRPAPTRETWTKSSPPIGADAHEPYCLWSKCQRGFKCACGWPDKRNRPEQPKGQQP
jgi:hypothetical protein